MNARENPWQNLKPKFPHRPKRSKPDEPYEQDRRIPARSSAGHVPPNQTTRRENSAEQENPANREQEAVVREISSGRLLAWHVLQQHDWHGQFLQDIFANQDSQHPLTTQDRAAAVDFASGIIRRRRTLDVLIASQVSRPRASMEPDLWRLLQLGAYQLVFAKTPDHAAVDTTVELCRQLDRERWTRITNGVLRGIGRMLTRDFQPFPTRLTVPTERGLFRRLSEEIFADPQTEIAVYVAEAFSLPDQMAERWASRYSRVELLATCFHTIEPPVMTLRVNPLRGNAEDIAARLTEHGVSVQPGLIPGSLRVAHAARIERLPGYIEGHWSVQDESAMSAATLLAPRPGEHVLDLCAAPGGKATHLAELSGDQASIIACDVSDSRLARITANTTRLQLTSITTQIISRDGAEIPGGPFDAVLVDVPCSNTGVLARRPEARWRFCESDLGELTDLQLRLLTLACEKTKPGGRIVYSTCSLEPEENRGVVERVIQSQPAFQLAEERTHRAGQPADGAYQALLVRNSS